MNDFPENKLMQFTVLSQIVTTSAIVQRQIFHCCERVNVNVLTQDRLHDNKNHATVICTTMLEK